MSALKYKNKNGEWVILSNNCCKCEGLSSVTWDSILNKPFAYPPEAHKHDISDINGLLGLLDSKVTIKLLEFEIEKLQTLINNLLLDNIKITISATPNSFYVGKAQQVNLKVTVTGTSEVITIKKDGRILTTSGGKTSNFTYVDTTTKTANYTAEITVSDKVLSANTVVTAKEAPVVKEYVYIGSGLTYNDVVKDNNKMDLIMNEKFKAVIHVTRLGDFPFIIVPEKVQSVKAFWVWTDLPLNQPEIQEINGIRYKVFKSNAMKVCDINLEITLK